MPTEAKRILVIEDEPDVAGLLKARLEANGYEVHLEDKGREALEDARALRPDLVILDLMLPDMDGYVVSETLRKHYRSWAIPSGRLGSWAVPILMLTARDQPRDKLRGYGAGADAYLTKPYDAQELLSTIAKLLRDAGSD
jgi:two-component system OmpR family response regulator